MINVGTSVIRTFSLIQYGSDQPVNKGVWITKVALYSQAYKQLGSSYLLIGNKTENHACV